MLRTVIAVVAIVTATIWLGTLAVPPAAGASSAKPHTNGAMKRVLFGAGGYNKAPKGVKARK
jgi:hypothetical protein